jgi:hypothetical protein
MKKIAILFVLCVQLSCSFNQSKSRDSTNLVVKPLVIFNDKEDGWGGDIRLSIVGMSENDTAQIYKAVSLYKGIPLGLLIFVPKRKTGDQGFGNGISLKSLGKESNNLLYELAKLYKQNVAIDVKFGESVSASFVDLKKFAKSVVGKVGEGDPNTMEYKLFIETKDDEAELFLNINPVDNWIELREKDLDYRTVVIKALTI